MKDFIKELNKIEKVIKKDAPTIIGVEAVNHFSKNFDKQGFDGKKWKDVKRRDSSSAWYGFQYGAKTPPPDSHPKRKGAVKKYKKRKTGATTNFSPVATQTPVLSSQRSELENSLYFKATSKKVSIKSDKEYAEVHNEGGKIKVFGKKSVTLPKRQFIGKSKELDSKIHQKLTKKLKS